MRFGVVVFPGTLCELDCHYVIGQVFGRPVEYVWHRDIRLAQYDCLILPGGFSYGDYLRAGAIARFAPIMKAVEEFAAAGGLVMGICNGFQILTEAGLLPGAFLRNDNLQFRCQWVHVRLENANTPFTRLGRRGQVLKIPINHQEGRYYADEATLRELRQNHQIVLRYCAPDGSLDPKANPNGSVDHIAGIINRKGNVFGLMPHPERCCEAALGGTHGRLFFQSLLGAMAGGPIGLGLY